MTNIINFPRRAKPAIEDAPKAATPLPTPVKAGIGAAVLKAVWVVVVLVWPILKWVVALDCVYHLIRMMYHWNTPGIHAGVAFLLHFAVLTMLTYFVSVYRPKGL
ncbi:KleE stable inheritance protein [Collimonas sp.]|jgi:hypothetical protein|uniref:KleE stable inheritance protein n=1 Tax=Collimonas sp. TaxID=1963772 RepID=UPI0037BE50F7